MTEVETDIVVIGGGIAGASAAYALAPARSVVLVEGEDQLGIHSTGRSAANYTENYGNGVIRRLTMASRAFLENPPTSFCDHQLMTPRGMMTIARQDQLGLLEAELRRGRELVPSMHWMSADEAIGRVEVLRRDYVAGAVFEPDARDIDVDGLHQGYLRGARAAGARILTGARVRSLARRKDRWLVETEKGRFLAETVVNAAGAWADEVAAMAGITPVGLVPKRRTAFTVALPEGVSAAAWPLVDDVGEAFYFKPDAGRLFVSPSDATPSPPMDAWPEEIDIATGIDRLQSATTIEAKSIVRAWAGLRTFAADGSPVVGLDETTAGFVWLAGQGGYGIKTSPALSQACRDLILFGRLPVAMEGLGVNLADLAPARLRRRGGEAPERSATEILT